MILELRCLESRDSNHRSLVILMRDLKPTSKVKNSKALTAIRTVFGLAIRIMRFEIAPNPGGNSKRREPRTAANREPRYKTQRKRDDNKNKICTFQGGGQGGREENCPKRYFSWETS